MKTIYFQFILIGFVFFSCQNGDENADAYGNFQATEIIVSAETSGKVLSFDANEGDEVKMDELVVQLDSVQLNLKLNELKARKIAVNARKSNISSQVAVYNQQLEVLAKDYTRIKNLLKDGAATQKQKDDIDGKISIVKKQIHSVNSNLESIKAEAIAIDVLIAQSTDMLQRSKVKTPVAGTILQKYIQQGEIAAPGKPLFKVADLNVMELKAYISGSQLSSIKLGDEVKVLIDGTDSLIEYPGKVSWIASEAEFTPKNIQTREERLSQVYAIKVAVTNNGIIKINMPGEVIFIHD